MKLYTILKTDFVYEDNRGKLTQLVHDGFKQVNVLLSEKNVIRGNHFHKKTREAFFIVDGSVEVTFSKDEFEEKATFSKGDFFLIEPYVNHSMFFLQKCLMIQLYDIPVKSEDGVTDIHS